MVVLKSLGIISITALIFILIWFILLRIKMKQCTVIVLEGVDGAGKETQKDLLVLGLSHMGYDVLSISFPNYGHWQCFLVEMYLCGKFNKDPNKINPRLASFFYAFDRFVTMAELSKKINKNTILVLDRYSTSNLGFQLTKFKYFNGHETYDTESSIIDFLGYIYYLEHVIFGIPKISLTINLHIDPNFACDVLASRGNSKHSGEVDIHESNISMITKANKVYTYLEHCNFNNLGVNFGRWKRVCVNSAALVGDEIKMSYKNKMDINKEIICIVKEFLNSSNE